MRKSIIYVILSLAVLPGCLDIKLESQFSDPYAITTVATARELLASAYNSIPRFQMEFSILSDDFVPTSYASKAADLSNLYRWHEKAIDDLSSQVWNSYYLTVAYVNALLPRLDNVVPKDESEALEIEKIRSEAKTLKAICYFDLLRLYGPVWSEGNADADGIILKNRLELDFLPRSSMKDCVNEIDALLSEAASVENDGTSVYYLSSSAVNALRAELELYRHDYKEAVRIGLPLLEDAEGRWTSTDYDNLWSGNDSRERLFAPYIFNTFYVGLNYDRDKGDYFALNSHVIYDEGDVRKAWCEYAGPQEGVINLGKYNRMYYENTDVRYINTIRYSGVCFTVAEAYARDGRPSEAIALMNRYLGARNAVLLDEGLSGEPLVLAILLEKQKEFVGEGIRLFDLKRLGKPLVRYGSAGNSTSVAPDDYRWLFPIPASEYRYNDKIVNINPGWPKQTVD